MELKFGGAFDVSRPRMPANFQPQSLDLKLLKKPAAQCSSFKVRLRFRIGFRIKVRVGSAGWWLQVLVDFSGVRRWCAGFFLYMLISLVEGGERRVRI